MIIDTTTYALSDKHYIKEQTNKKQIVIGHTSTNQMRHVTKWENRLNGEYKKTAAFTISKDGNIYQHFDPIYFSNSLMNLETNKKSIVVLLENEGWLAKNIDKKDFINWIGHIYNDNNNVVERKWRNYSYWAPYTTLQFASTIQLVNNLCDEFFINKFAMHHNTIIDNLDEYNGILYKSNLQKNYTDLSPAWNFEKFKQDIENYEK